MIVISQIDYYCTVTSKAIELRDDLLQIAIANNTIPSSQNRYIVFNDEQAIAVGVDWNNAIKLVSELAPIVWTTNNTQETLDYDNNPDPILRKGKLYVYQMYLDRFNKYVVGFNEETGLIDDDTNATSYVTDENVDYFFNYEDALSKYKHQVDNKLSTLYEQLNYWSKVKASLE